MSTNEARAWKRNRCGTSDYTPGRPSYDEHIMMKAEAKVMRRLQAETGLSEEEIRSHKKYRKILSDAQTNPKGPSRSMKVAKRLLKGITSELKLAKEHPKVVEEAMKQANEWSNGWRSGYLNIVPCMKTLLGK